MKRFVALFAMLLAAPAASAADAGADVKPPDGFQKLFNGKDLSGWKGLVASPPKRAEMSAEALAAEQEKADASMREHWTIEDGVLTYDGKGQSLCTDKDYADFEMYVDWKIKDDGDSGIYVRGSPQIQIWDPNHWKVGSGGLYNNKKNPSAPTIIADNPIGEWNTMYVRMIGDRVTVKLNGKLVTDNVVLENYWERDKPIYPTGQIELQHHGNTLWFRNIFIRELAKPDELKKIEEAAPAKATAVPKKDRNVLVFMRHAGYRHSSIPVGARAVQLLGDKSGAFTSKITDDLTELWPGNIDQYDGVVMVNTTGEWIQPRAEDLEQIAAKYGEKLSAAEAEAKLKKSLLDFVSSGKGLVGFHAASDANYKWPEFGQMVGGYFNAHPWHEKVGVKVDSPTHPLMAAFGGKDFSIVDEIYQFRDPYSRKAVHVLLSLDVEKTNMDKKNIRRDDGDFAVSWVRNWGEGRVFYSSLGHREEIYWNPQMLAFYLDGIQFALGDLDAEATPSVQ
ncbi:family 16 glycoside hydrolase [Blastopirellula marina]|uniref:Trehalose utilization n=1 Tax=Blastopirellula marina DSM 3645 TaxID=314230 RepID=A3ZWX6_9BACT|nr:family 16 glycoside hydrolase [Blastopirellula marina]EAQ79100.1 hypothetical protein DSM3645_14090 [Blastopirellula marina DSM 3645]